MFRDFVLVAIGVLLGVGVVVVPFLVVLGRLVPRLEVHSLRAAVDLLMREVFGGGRHTPRGLERAIAIRVRDQHVTFSSGRVFAVGTIIVWLSTFDYKLLLSNVPSSVLAAELARLYGIEAVKRNWMVPSDAPTLVDIRQNPQLGRGVIDVEGRLGGTYATGHTGGEPIDASVEHLESSFTPERPSATKRFGDDSSTEVAEQPLCSAILTYRGRRSIVFAGDGPVLLGRSPEAIVRLDEGDVSRRHSQLEHRATGWFLVPLEKSTSRTLISGEVITGPTQLLTRSDIRFGSASHVEVAPQCVHSKL